MLWSVKNMYWGFQGGGRLTVLFVYFSFNAKPNWLGDVQICTSTHARYSLAQTGVIQVQKRRLGWRKGKWLGPSDESQFLP